METFYKGRVWYRAKKCKAEKPQAAAFKKADSLGHRIVVALADPIRKGKKSKWYTSFPDITDLFEYYIAFGEENRAFYALDRSCDADEITSAFHADCEWITEERDSKTPQRLAKILSAIKGELPELKEHKLFDFGRKQSDGKYKNSFHFHIPSIVFANNKEVGNFVNTKLWLAQGLCNDPLMKHNNESIIDFGIYTRHRLFRLPGSAKLSGEPVPKNMPHCVQDLLDAIPAWYRPITHTATEEETKKCQRKYTKPSRFVTPDGDTTARHLTDLLRQKGDMFTTVRRLPDGRYVGITSPEHGRTCLIKGEHNKSDNCFFIIDKEGYAHYHCFDSEAHPRCAGKVIGRLPGHEAPSMWAPGVRINNHDEPKGFLRPLIFDDCDQVIAVAAHCGRGKSFALKKLVRRMLKEAPEGLRILVVSARISHAAVQKGQFGGLGFIHYKDKKFWESDRVICQYESLHNLSDHNVKGFDLMIMDEARSIVDQMLSSETNGKFLGRNARYFYALLSRPGVKVVALDADLESDGTVPALLQHIATSPIAIRVERYTQNPTKRKFYVTRDRKHLIDKVKEEAKAGEKTAIACATKACAEAWAQLIKKERPDLKTELIHGDVNDTLKTGMQNPEDFLAEIDVLIFTSVITVGASVEMDWHMLLVDASSRNGCGPRQLMQMVGRFREMQVERVDVLYPPKPTKADVNYTLCHRLERAKRDLRERETDIQQYQGMIRFQETFDEDGSMLLAPDWFTELHIYARAEKLAQFEEEFKRQAGRHQFPLIMEEAEQDEAAETKAEFKEYKELAKADRENLFKDAFDLFKDCPPDELHQRLQDLKAKTDANEASAYEKIQLASVHTLKLFRGDGGDDERREKQRALTYDEFKTAHENKQPMYNIAAVLKKGLLNEEILMHERNRLRKRQYINTADTPLWHMTALKTVQAFEVLGIQNAGLSADRASTVSFTKKDVIANRAKIIELTSAAARAGGGRLRSRLKVEKVANDPSHAPLKGLRQTLQSNFGGTIKGRRKKKRDGDRDKIEEYVIEQNRTLVDLAMLSDAYEGDQSANTIVTGSNTIEIDTIIEPPLKKRKANEDQTTLKFTNHGLKAVQ